MTLVFMYIHAYFLKQYVDIFLILFFLGKPAWILWTDINQVIKFKSLSFVTYRMNAFWEWFYGTPAGYFSMEKSANMYIVHTKFIPQNCQCAQVYPVHRCRKIFRIQYRTWNLVNKINALHGHWSTHSLTKFSSQSVPTIFVFKAWVGLWPL